ncbi:MAG: FG-GAP repeat protein [Woeseiaceae bacterium]|nr:FG-GAP repeat protein [Woeseiaceae bacterium]
MKNRIKGLLLASGLAGVTLLAVHSVFASILNEFVELLASDGAVGDLFGQSVAIDGDSAIVGAVQEDAAAANAGAAYVFLRSAGIWSEQQKLIPADGDINDQFGIAVDIDGDTAVIGAVFNDGVAIDSGAAYVFTRTGSTWSQQAKLTASDGATTDAFGQNVAIDGDTVVIAAEQDNDAGTNSGSAYVFVRSGTAWTEQAKLTASDAAAFDRFGFSVDVDGDTVIVGAHLNDDLGGSSGSAYVFTRSGAVWSEQAKLLASDGVNSHVFGVAVALDGDTAVIGASGDDDVALDSGAAYLFSRSGTTWTEQAKLTASDGGVSDQFGRSISVNGSRAVIGARADDDNGTDSGAAYVFELSGASGAISETDKLLPSDGAAFDTFGIDVAVSSSTVVVGAVAHDHQGSNSGSAYVFDLVTDDEGPAISNTTATPNPVAVTNGVTLTAIVDDTATGGSNIASATYTVDGGSPIAMTAQDGTFDEPSEGVTAAVAAFATPDVHQLCVTGTDAAGNSGDEDCTLLAVFDPSAGFVTGGGWIDSPANACQLTPACQGQTGKANFGFVSKYQQGAQTPTGNTKFLFKAGDLNFDSDSYEWLVVANHKAQYKGDGRVNGSGNYGFMLFAIDADLTPSTNVDLFRIKIWDKDNNDLIVYDNEPGADEDDDPTTEIGGGSIVIHP